MKIGIIAEGKVPQDTRVTLTPKQCVIVKEKFGINIQVMSSKHRCFKDDEYSALGINVVDNVNDCDVLIGVKEVPIDELIANKTYFFFSHTIKAQPYNRDLLQAIVQKNIRLIDYEAITKNEMRVIAFGRWAGIVGAHNGLLAWGLRTGEFELPRMYKSKDLDEVKTSYAALKEMSAIKIVLTGGGRVAKGAKELLDIAGIKEVDKETFIYQNFNVPVYTQIDVADFYQKGDTPIEAFDIQDFFQNPSGYHSIFEPFAHAANMFINGVYWDNRAPAYFTLKEMQKPDFKIKVIADITCDIAPEASVPSTIRPSTIIDPIYSFDIKTGTEQIEDMGETSIHVMAVDNLPNELPRDASNDFGNQFIESVIPELLNLSQSKMLYNASMTLNGDLNMPFEYLRDYLNNK